MDLSDLIVRNAAFTPEKPALRRGSTLIYAALAQRIAAQRVRSNRYLASGAATVWPSWPQITPIIS